MRGPHRLICILIASCLLPACADFKPPTESQRTASFADFAPTTVTGEPLETFLKKRTAFVVSGSIEVAQVDVAGRTIALRFTQQPNRTVHLGLAAAVDHRGYFLTAAHVVEHLPCYLVFWDGEKARVAVPRIVAQTNGPPDDLALLHIDANLPAVFEWARDEQAHEGANLVAIGTAHVEILAKTMATSTTAPLGGRILSLTHNLQSLRINTTMPLRPGDSGGPVASPAGSLLGINSGVHVNANGEQYGFCTRPSPEWVAREIGVDVKNSHPDRPASFSPLKDRHLAHLILTLW